MQLVTDLREIGDGIAARVLGVLEAAVLAHAHPRLVRGHGGDCAAAAADVVALADAEGDMAGIGDGRRGGAGLHPAAAQARGGEWTGSPGS